MPDKSAVEQIKELDQQRSRLLSQAKQDAMSRAQTAVADLNALGFSYRLAESGKAVSAAPSRKGTRQVKDAPCPVCNFKTSPPHDARKHRSQGNRKKPFSTKELADHALRKVA